MITATEKQELVEWVKNLEDAYFLQQLKALKKIDSTEFEANISEAELVAIDKALDPYQKGNFYSYEEVKEQMKKKFSQLLKDK